MKSDSAEIHVVAAYRHEPAEGMQIVSKTLIDGLRESGRNVTVIEPDGMSRWLPRLAAERPSCVVFTHGPGSGVVLASAVLRCTTRAHIVWVATRPDLGTALRYPGRIRTAHSIVGNQLGPDLARVAPGAQFLQHFIGIDTSRLGEATGESPWPELGRDRTVALHVGHLRRNRNLEVLAEASQLLGPRIQIVVQGSPTFEADPQLVDELESAGVIVRQGFVDNLVDLYTAADLYLFPLQSDQAGAIELPLSVLEAVSSGLPVLTNDFGALRPALGTTTGVHFTTPARFTNDLASLVAFPERLARGPSGLPDRLDASHITSAIINIAREQN
ncbi:MAG: glycosyltransferase involved in cell wall biosynthesis [Candidatus Poriferisodalaceae bacterium]